MRPLYQPVTEGDGVPPLLSLQSDASSRYRTETAARRSGGSRSRRDECIHVHGLYARHASVLHESESRSARRFHRIFRRDRSVGCSFRLSRGRLWRQSLRRQCQMLSAQGRGPSPARKRVGWLAVTNAEQVLSLAWNPVKGDTDSSADNEGSDSAH